MDLEFWSFSLKLVNFAGVLAVAAYTYFSNRSKRIDEFAQRLRAVETKIEAAPGREELHAIMLALTEMRGDLREIGAEMRAHKELMTRMDNVVTRHEDHLLNKAMS